MSHTNTYDATSPLDNTMLGKGAEEIRKTKLDIVERITPDHYMDGELDTSKPGADGYHRKVTLGIQSSDPALLSESFVITSISIGTDAVVTSEGNAPDTGEAINLTTTGALPTGLAINTAYFVKKINSDTFNLCPTYADAIAGTNLIDTSGTQSGTHTCVKPLCGITYAKADGLYFRNAAGIVKLI